MSVGIFKTVSSRRGFTLVELLVVIAIIGVLVGLLMPAIVNARLSALQTVCANNQSEIAKAIILYDSNKDRLPYAGRGDKSNLKTWQDQILEDLGMGQQYQDVCDGKYNSPAIKLFKCPVGDAPATGFSYVVNVGNSSLWPTLTSTPDNNVRGSGLFFFFDDSKYVYKKSSISSIKDGASNTILLSEKCYKRIPGITADINTQYSPYEYWDKLDTTPNYKRFGLYWDTSDNQNNNSNFPSSRHAQINNIAFADGSVRAISKSIQIQTYRALMSPNDKYAGVTMPTNDPNYK